MRAPGVGGRKTRQIQPSSSLLYQGVLLQARVALFVRPLSSGSHCLSGQKKDKTKKEVLRSSAACENRVSIHLSRLLDVQAAAQPARKRSLTYSQLLLRRGRSRHSTLEDD